MIRYDRNTANCVGDCVPHFIQKGCIDPPPIQKQCSFPKDNAVKLCSKWKLCNALNCNIYRDDCQVRYHYDTKFSFGEAYIYTKINISVSTQNEHKTYKRIFSKHYFVYDALYIYRTFFKELRNFRGFFVESGALDGSIYGSNSFYYENYLRWDGLLIEAESNNFKRLVKRRNSSRCVHTALCSRTQKVKFSSSGGCCGKIGFGNNIVSCTRTAEVFHKNNISRIDFWSLDVEGNELDVLNGMDWSIPVYILLIEAVTFEVRSLLISQGFVRHEFSSPSKLNEIWKNENNRPIG